MITKVFKKEQKSSENFPNIMRIYAKSEKSCSHCGDTIKVGDSCVTVMNQAGVIKTVCYDCNKAYEDYRRIKSLSRDLKGTIDREQWLETLGRAAAELEFRGFDMHKRFVTL